MATPKDKEYTAEEVLAALTPIKGEQREVYRCERCGQFIGRRFVPFGLGRGLTINPCWDFVTDKHVPLTAVLSAKP